MEKTACCKFMTKRRFWANLPMGVDLITAIVHFCKTHEIQMASFAVSGAVSMVTTGVYDQKQQVFVTQEKKGAYEIVSGTGTIVSENQNNTESNGYFVDGQIVLADMAGNLSGGKLFSKTIIFAAEMELTQLLGDPITRAYDQTTGRMRLNL